MTPNQDLNMNPNAKMLAYRDSILCKWNMNEMYPVYKGMLDPIIISE